MMTIRALIAKMDGKPDRNGHGFPPGSIPATTGLPVTQDFNPRKPPLGTADLEIDANGDVYAVMEVRAADVVGRFPALGGHVLHRADPSRYTFQPAEVSICGSNADPRIPPIE